MTATSLIFIGLAIIAYMVIAVIEGRKIKTVEEYFLAKRKLNLRRFLGSYSATNVTFTAVFLYLCAEGTLSGNIPFWAAAFWMIGTILFVWLYPRISKFCKQGFTLHEYLEDAFDSSEVRRIASWVTIVTFVAGVGLEFYGFSWLMEHLSGGAIQWAVIGGILLLIMVAYTTIGGYPATVSTDLLQLFLIVVGTIVIVLYGVVPSWDNTVSARVFDTNHLFSDPLLILAYLVLFVPFQFSIMDNWQRCVSAGGDERIVRRATFGGGVIVSLVLLVPVILGMTVGLEQVSDTNSLDSLLVGINRVPPGILTGIVMVCFLSSLFSTADTLLLNAAYSLVYDQQIGRQRTKVSPQEFMKSEKAVPRLRTWVAIMGIGSMVSFLILWVVPLSAYILALLASQSILGFLVLYHLSLKNRNVAKRRRKGALRAIILGFSLPIIIVSYGLFVADKDFINGAPFLAVIIAVIVFFVTPRSKMLQDSQEQVRES